MYEEEEEPEESEEPKKYLLLVNDRDDKGEPVGLFTNGRYNSLMLSQIPWCVTEETDENEYGLAVDAHTEKIKEIIRDGLLPYYVYSEHKGSYEPMISEPYMCMWDSCHPMGMKGEYEFNMWAKNPADAIKKARRMRREEL